MNVHNNRNLFEKLNKSYVLKHGEPQLSNANSFMANHRDLIGTAYSQELIKDHAESSDDELQGRSVH